MRCFIAILLPDGIKDYAEACRNHLSRARLPVKWVARDNYHLTVKFLGDLEEDKINDVKRVLIKCTRETGAFTLHAENLGCFPRWQRPRILWLGIGGQTEPAIDLIQRVDRALAKRGFKKEDHQLHLTLGRIRQGQELASGELLAGCSQETLNPGRSASFDVDALYLMESQLGPKGPTYYIKEKYKLHNQI